MEMMTLKLRFEESSEEYRKEKGQSEQQGYIHGMAPGARP